MAIFQDWVDELLKDPFANGIWESIEKVPYCIPAKEEKGGNIKVPEQCIDYKKTIQTKPKNWPYSTFFDWSLNSPVPGLKGFLPDILGKNVGTAAGKMNPGLTNKTYYVNPNYIFFGLNPSRDFTKIPGFHPGDQNKGNFINFTLASEYDFINHNWLPYSSWRNIGFLVKAFDMMHPAGKSKFSKTLLLNIYTKFLGSYMTDIAPILSVPDKKKALECLRKVPSLRSRCFAMVKRELDIFKKYVKPAPEQLTVFCFGRKETFLEVTTFAATIGKGLFPGARIIEVGHYSQNGNHLKLTAELDCILKGVKPQFESVWG